MSSSRKPNAKAADILRPFPPEVRKVAQELQRLVQRAIPTATEHPYIGWKGIGYRDPQAGYFAGIFPQPDHVRLLFEHGASLEDPEGILQGDNVRQVRWILVHPGAQVPEPAITSMLRRAVIFGSLKKRRQR
jgi:hypothetical protein